jgi:hypothetical protein
VTPEVLGLPLTFSYPSLLLVMDVELKARAGCFSTWKKSVPFGWDLVEALGY